MASKYVRPIHPIITGFSADDIYLILQSKKQRHQVFSTYVDDTFYDILKKVKLPFKVSMYAQGSYCDLPGHFFSTKLNSSRVTWPCWWSSYNNSSLVSCDHVGGRHTTTVPERSNVKPTLLQWFFCTRNYSDEQRWGYNLPGIDIIIMWWSFTWSHDTGEQFSLMLKKLWKSHRLDLIILLTREYMD